jgi:trk system potassium uptake protein TrkH
MQYKTILRIIGVLLMLFSLSMLPPVLVAEIYHDGALLPFLVAFSVTLLTGVILWLTFRHQHHHLTSRDGFMIVTLFWVVLSLFGALPLIIANHPHDSFTDAIFEAVSGLTTTGGSVQTGLDFLPHAIRFYRQELQFLGGMGIVVLAIAVLPMLGVGGMQLYRAETPGPMKESKLTPRITDTAKTLWYIYVGLTAACCLAYWAAGMTFFDALGESFGTVSTGGFTMHDSSFAYYHSNLIYSIAIIFMFLGGVNFSLHFLSLKNVTLKYYFADLEMRWYFAILALTSIITVAVLSFYHIYSSVSEAFFKGVFTVVSLATTTGFVNAHFDTWPSFLPILIMLIALIGACGGSTSGGAKVMRFVLLSKQSTRELRRLVHPRAVLNIKFGRTGLRENTINSMWAFIAIYLSIGVLMTLALMATGLDLSSAFSSMVSALANSGAAIGSVTDTFKYIGIPAKWILIFGMLAGRLEVFTLLVLFTPTYWRG